LHVVNTQRTRAVKASIQIEGRRVQSGRVLEIADDPMVEVTYLNSADVMRVVEKPISQPTVWEFPAASVSAVELNLA
ncbi:MAG TPA: alpha-L-arabinofuranosidase, partial [Blastocatellia bacterium]|nr:alpha-L-arabinofuranosidase [Blastocatellia bacterium]